MRLNDEVKRAIVRTMNEYYDVWWQGPQSEEFVVQLATRLERVIEDREHTIEQEEMT